MFKRKTLLFTTSVLVGLAAIFITVALLSPDEASVAAVGVPDTPEAHQIQKTMNRAYDLMAIAARTFDVSEFSTVFVDTPDSS